MNHTHQASPPGLLVEERPLDVGIKVAEIDVTAKVLVEALAQPFVRPVCINESEIDWNIDGEPKAYTYRCRYKEFRGKSQRHEPELCDPCT